MKIKTEQKKTDEYTETTRKTNFQGGYDLQNLRPLNHLISDLNDGFSKLLIFFRFII